MQKSQYLKLITRNSHYFTIIRECKEVLLCLFSYQILASTVTMDEWSIYYKVYDVPFLPLREHFREKSGLELKILKIPVT